MIILPLRIKISQYTSNLFNVDYSFQSIYAHTWIMVYLQCHPTHYRTLQQPAVRQLTEL